VGLYINLPDQEKEEWLRERGAMMLSRPKDYKSVGSTGTYWVVCLVFNSEFSAAGVCFSQQELEEFSHEGDRRMKQWFLVEEQDLLTVVPNLLEREKEANDRL